MHPLPIRDEFVLVQFRPGFDQPVLAARENATDQLNGVNAINTDSVLVVRVEMRPVMWSTGFGIHTNNDPKKAGNFWRALIIPQDIGLILSSCRRRSNARRELRLEAVSSTPWFGESYASKTCETCAPTPRHRLFSPEPVPPLAQAT